MPGQNVIRISPSGLGLPDREYYYTEEDERIQTAYKEFIRDVIIYLSTARNEATKFGTDMFSYEKRIAEVTPNTISLQNPIVTYNAISLAELKETNMIPFFDIIQAMYPQSNISENTEVIVTSLEYLGQIAQIIATTDRRTMNGYLIWTLVRNYVPYLSTTFTTAGDTFNSELFGIQQPPERWEICSRMVINFMGFAADSLISKSEPVSEESIKIMNGTFSALIDIMNEKINHFRNSPLLYNHLQSKLNSLKLQVGIPEFARKDAFLKEFYLPLRIIKSNFFESVKNGMTFQISLKEKLLNKNVPGMWQLLNMYEEPRIRYFPSEQTIIIPRSLLSQPLFEEGFASPVIYGRLGIEIAEAIVSSILPHGSLWTSDKKILSPFHMTVNDSFKSVEIATKCLGDYILNLNLAIPYATANETALNTLIHLIAVEAAKEALLVKIRKTEHIHQPSLEEYEDSALFFLAYAQTQCSETTSQYNLYQDLVNFELPQRTRLHLIWTQLPDFPDSFYCSYNKNLQCPQIF